MTVTHRMSGTPTYESWLKMRARCLDPNNNRYDKYGARGITVCPEWFDSFEAFLRDMGERPPGTTLGRRDNDGPYCKDNCRWETPTQQARNTSTTLFIEYEGQQRPLREVAELTGIPFGTMWSRINRGKDPFDDVRVDSHTGSKGVTKHSRGKKQYQARIIVNGKRRSLGYFHTLKEAEAAYQQALNEVQAE